MPNTAIKMISTRSEAHSDVAVSAAARKHLAELTEVNFARLLLKELRNRPGGLVISDFKEEWRRTGDGALYEITAHLRDAG